MWPIPVVIDYELPGDGLDVYKRQAQGDDEARTRPVGLEALLEGDQPAQVEARAVQVGQINRLASPGDVGRQAVAIGRAAFRVA